METALQILLNGMVAGAIYALVASGFAVIFQISRFFDFAFAATLTVAAYAAVCASSIVGAPLIVVIVAGPAMALVTGASFEYVVYRPLRHQGSPSLVLILSSLGLMIATLNIISLVFGDSPRFVTGFLRIESVAIVSARVTPLQIGIMLIAVTTAIACWWVFRYTRWGLIVRAVANDDNLALCVGSRTDRVILQTMIFGSALGGLAATLAALDTGLTPLLGFRLLLPGVVAAIVGGIGRISGALLGGLAIGIVEQFGGWFVSTAWQDTILFVILILFLIVRPQGFFGKPLSKASV